VVGAEGLEPPTYAL